MVAGNLAEASLLIKSTGEVIRQSSDSTNETDTNTGTELDALRLIVRYPHHGHGELSAGRPELAAIVMIADRTA